MENTLPKRIYFIGVTEDDYSAWLSCLTTDQRVWFENLTRDAVLRYKYANHVEYLLALDMFTKGFIHAHYHKEKDVYGKNS